MYEWWGMPVVGVKKYIYSDSMRQARDSTEP